MNLNNKLLEKAEIIIFCEKNMKNIKRLNWKKMLSLALIAMGFIFLFTSKASAKECYSVYGGGEVCERGDLRIDKKVFDPKADKYVDNLASEDYTFKVGEEILFRLTIKNISEIRIDNARINDDFDKIDEYLNFLSSNEGDYRFGETDWKVKFDALGALDPDEEVTVYFKAQVKGANDIPVGLTCMTNVAHAYSHDDITSDSDSSDFCIGTESAKIVKKETPETGVDLSSILAIEAVALLGLGAFSLKKAKSLSK